MGINRIFIYVITGLILSGCAQTTAMVGPALTLVSTGNVSQAGVTFITNRAVKEETGMDTVSFVSKKIEEKQSENKLRRDFQKLVETNFVKTREKLISQDQSNTFN
tara:strand:+ start:150 stop:467 length:318 start_codon:yes stop_codon:yes gene_type:complete